MRNVVIISKTILGGFCAACVAHGMNAPAQTLPSPAGAYSVGRVRFHWADSKRPEVLAADPKTRREINLEVWYPAQSDQPAGSAQYLPDLATIQARIPEQEFKDEFDSAAGLIESSQIKTHSIPNARIASSPRRFPVLVFSHGLGVPPEGYTSQAEDLASHGFVVVAIEHTYDAFVSVFPDGRVIDYEDNNWESKKGEVHAAYTRLRVDVWTSDILFVIDKLFALNKAKGSSLLSEHLDMQRLGVFGHSMGGLAAIVACERDKRIRACLDEDSLINGTPFTQPQQKMTQPYMIFLTSSNFSPTRTDAQLARGGVARATFDANVLRSQEELKASLRSHGGKPSLAVLRDSSVEHMNFSDFKILQSADQTQTAAAVAALQNIRQVVLAFFDSSLLKKSDEMERLSLSDSPVRIIFVH